MAKAKQAFPPVDPDVFARVASAGLDVLETGSLSSQTVVRSLLAISHLCQGNELLFLNVGFRFGALMRLVSFGDLDDWLESVANDRLQIHPAMIQAMALIPITQSAIENNRFPVSELKHLAHSLVCQRDPAKVLL